MTWHVCTCGDYFDASFKLADHIRTMDSDDHQFDYKANNDWVEID